jgi:hypothetical protein
MSDLFAADTHTRQHAPTGPIRHRAHLGHARLFHQLLRRARHPRHIPFVRDLFRMSRPHADDALVIVTAGAGALLWMELVKRYANSTERGQS